MENTPNYLDEDLRKELECPVCFEYMKSPIAMCEYGHSICSICKPKMKNCPSCRKPFLNVRNLALESLSAMFVNTNTAFKNSGSPVKKYKCPFSTISHEDCVWDGFLHDMKHHIKTSHSGVNYCQKSNGKFNVVLTDVLPQCHYRKAVCVGTELFYLVWEIKEGNFYCAVLYIGPKNMSSKFTYKFSLTTDSGMKNISMLLKTQSVVQNIEHFFRPGDCVLLHYETVLKFLNSEKFLDCGFEINQIENASVGVKSKSHHGSSNDVSFDRECLTEDRERFVEDVKRELLASYDKMSEGIFPPNSDVYRNGRGSRRSRGGGRSRFNRAGRRGAGNRSLEAQGGQESVGVPVVRQRNKLGKNPRFAQSLTDLRDEAHYQVKNRETLAFRNLSDTLHAEQIKVSPSCTSSAVKDKIDKSTSVSALIKSQNKVEASDSTVKPTGLPTTKNKPREQLTKVSAVGKPQGNFQKKVPGVTSGEFTPGVHASMRGNTDDKSRTSYSRTRSASRERVMDFDVLDKSRGNFKADVPTTKSSGLALQRFASLGNLSTVPKLAKLQDKPEKNYYKLYSIAVDDCDFTGVVPFDTSVDRVKTSDSKTNAPTNVSTSIDIPSQQGKNMSPNVLLRNNHPNTAREFEEYWKCTLCGYLVPIKQTNHDMQNVDFAPPGTNRICKFCGQWRP